ncbi:MAG: MBL fold metallo-hydrolase [Candidatus Marinimicrobia bacterium]|nr:MBL fold metallo-hydrolase [Candidatus Neomarinimicrobiota bacterium]
MKFKIHRGTKEIGGSCVEVWTDSTRILLDIGMPLVNPDGSDFDFKKYQNKSSVELVKENILPDVQGIYKDSKKLIDGILISHAHYDHFGFSQFLHEDSPYYLGEATQTMIKLNTIFTPNTDNIHKTNYIKHRKSFVIGDLTITPYLMDHSAFDAYAFLIEHDGKTLFYSGDFRAHGRKSAIFDEFLRKAKKVDYLLMEGTTLGRTPKGIKTEDFLENELAEKFKEKKTNLIYTSGQNIDRLVSIYRACKKSNKILVLDLYIASVLQEISKLQASIPHPGKDWSNIAVWYTKSLSDRLAENNKDDLYRFKNFKIVKEDINENPDKYVIVVRPYLKPYFEKHMPNIKDGNFIYSMWEGYLKKKNNYANNFIDYLKNDRGFTQYNIHTSGHAYTEDLKRLVRALNPEKLIPIHTFESLMFEEYFENVHVLNDNEELEVR